MLGKRAPPGAAMFLGGGSILTEMVSPKVLYRYRYTRHVLPTPGCPKSTSLRSTLSIGKLQ